jgi:hypothetical protein
MIYTLDNRLNTYKGHDFIGLARHTPNYFVIRLASEGGRHRRIRGAPENESRVKRLGPQMQKPRGTTCPGAALSLRYGAI